MKTVFATLILLCGLARAQIVTIGGQTSWGDTLRWGGSADSTSSLLVRGNAVYRDSAGTWVAITTDSCSKPVRATRGYQRSVWKDAELSYEVRASSGNTDSTQIVYRVETRYCLDEINSRNCDSWVRSGRLGSNLDITIQDTVLSAATTLGTTWNPAAFIFNAPRGNQKRVCVDSYQAGGATGDSTFFRRHVLRFQ